MACSSASSPASGEEEKKEQKLINAMFLCDEWKSSKGGLSTFNRQFAIKLAETTAGSMQIHCYVSNSDDRDREDAEQFGVNLIKARSVPGSADPLECLKFPPLQLQNTHLVIGHGRKLGSPAYSLAQFTKCKWIQFVHVYCEDLGKYKESDTAAEDTIEEHEKKHKMEIDLCKAADAVVAVGSRLQQKYSRRLLNVEVKVITPGIFEEFSNESKLAVDRSVVKKFNVSVFGRAAFEDFSLKGYDIIANAIGSLGNNFELTFVGSSPSGQRKVQQWFLDNSCINRNQLTIRRYCSEREELKMMFYQSDLVALPSRTEGFGLVALEAISAGVPVLVSGESGIAEALQKVEGGNTVIVGSDEYEGEWARRIREMYEESAEEREVNAVKLCENYRKVYSWKAECERFKGLIEKVVENGATSSEFHSISSTSESPQNQEELKKWKQKTKIVETEKLKAMLPLLGSSTSDPEEELEELHMKLQIMKGATSSEFHSISSTSESPQNQEELKKWKQKTKIVETEKLKGIDKIDDITEMVTTMALLKISTKGPATLDEMKAKVKETLQSSQKKSSWTAKEAFSVLTEAKKEDERKRATLFSFYERTDVCLQSMDGKVHALLEQNIGNLKEKIASHKQNLLKKEYIVLVAGETSSGKSTLLNLILGEQLLPYSILSTTSTICELRYGDTPKLVAHFKNKELGDTTKTVVLDEPSEASEQSYLQQISQFVHRKTNREKGSDYEKIELFWPHNLLKENIVIVDSPGISESTIMDDIVKEYLPEAFAFIYVIKSDNAGGIQRDRVEKLIEHARQVSLDKQRAFTSNCALFVCNKWDQVPPEETDEVKNYVVTKLTQCWPSLDPESRIIYMSAREAIEAQKLGIVTKEFAELMKSIKSMVLKSIEARLEVQWRWLDHLLARMALHTKAFIRNSSKDRKNLIDRMMLITDRLQSIERQQSTVSKELQSYLEKKTDDAVTTLSRYLKSAEVMQQFSSWTLDDAPKTGESWELTQNYIQKALMNRLQETTEEWEEKNHVFSDARASLIPYFQERFSYVVGQLRTLEESVLAGDAANSAGGPLASDDFSVAEKVIIGVTSPIWVPVGLVVLVVSVPVVGAIAVKEKLKNWNKTRQYNKDKCAFMAKASQEYLNEAAEEQQLKSYVMEQLKEAQVCLKQVLERIPQLIEEDKMLCQQLRDENRSKKEVEDFCQPLHERSVKIRDEMALFGIKEVRTMDISCDDLEWKDNALLGSGTFAAVYRGKLNTQGEDKPVDVAVKVWNEELNEDTASGFLSEAEILRRLNYPSIVKFYGTALHKEGGQLKAVLVTELCKENLRTHIFRHEGNIPGKSSTATAARDMIGWAKDIADALEYIHRQGIVHRDLKLENILLSQENIAKVADVGVSKEAKAITGTMAGTPLYLAPEVIKSSLYDYKADIYSFGIMLWEMWYGDRALLDVIGNMLEFFEKVGEGVRPTHVRGSKKPPPGLHDLMQRCWDEKPDNRPDASECYEKLAELYQEFGAPSS